VWVAGGWPDPGPAAGSTRTLAGSALIVLTVLIVALVCRWRRRRHVFRDESEELLEMLDIIRRHFEYQLLKTVYAKFMETPEHAALAVLPPPPPPNNPAVERPDADGRAQTVMIAWA
jgi:hypothetical protein